MKTCLSLERGFLRFVKFSLFRRWVNKVTQRLSQPLGWGFTKIRDLEARVKGAPEF